MKTNLPLLSVFDDAKFSKGKRRLLIAAEGFEERSIYWLHSLPVDLFFDDAYVCKYKPEKKARLGELLDEIVPRTINEPRQIEFHRFEPTFFEIQMHDLLKDNAHSYEEIVIDVSVMSKLLIIIILWLLREYSGCIKIIYSEPEDYAPKFDEYEKQKHIHGKSLVLPSYGVHEVIRTPQLSSIIMQRYPALVLAFTSFNEQLIRALLSSINPSRLFLVNGVPPALSWREKATSEIHEKLAREYSHDNLFDNTTGSLVRKTSTLYYYETFALLSDIYKQYCCEYRIVVAPTGSKMQSVACALFKICCPDIHIEYPTPESFFISSYSSEKIKKVHELNFDCFRGSLKSISNNYELNG